MAIDLDVAPIREALKGRLGFWRQISSESGVSYSWISKFVNGKIPNPGVETLRALRDTLARPARRR
jgi:transcriptional regulator with XRE-family HTH domain